MSISIKDMLRDKIRQDQDAVLQSVSSKYEQEIGLLTERISDSKIKFAEAESQW